MQKVHSFQTVEFNKPDTQCNTQKNRTLNIQAVEDEFNVQTNGMAR
jgi:hypothetical protein